MIRRNVRFLTPLFVSAILCHVFGQEPTPSDAKPSPEEALRAAEEAIVGAEQQDEGEVRATVMEEINRRLTTLQGVDPAQP